MLFGDCGEYPYSSRPPRVAPRPDTAELEAESWTYKAQMLLETCLIHARGGFVWTPHNGS